MEGLVISQEKYQALVDELRVARTDDGESFAKLVAKSLELLEISDQELALAFDMSRPTVNRWRNGQASPHPLLRKHVFAYLVRQARKAIKVEERGVGHVAAKSSSVRAEVGSFHERAKGRSTGELVIRQSKSPSDPPSPRTRSRLAG